MIRTYLMYIVTSLITFWVVLFLFGVSAGFANYAPIIAMLGTVLLFSIASPLLVIKKRLGLVFGLIGGLLILPFDIGFTAGVFEDGLFNWGVVLGFVPIILVLLSLFYTVKELKVKGEQALSNIVRITMIGVPILLSILYIVIYGKYWSWQMFGI
ncbi:MULTISPECIES: hypothetical protein [Olivibacter]|jgi:hypothetical protein|uniref:Uncharacterized protein n=1 Tax=Olivibacter oleidegradans TaxID=760123 RepID=A0ABV6HGH0_9SPHI|nr:hypothetical protein [Olivibacter jilunii]